MRLIDAEELLKKFSDGKSDTKYERDVNKVARYIIRHSQTIDAEQVVRCKDCKSAYINSFSVASGVVLCRRFTNKAEGVQFVMRFDDFCSHGEKKED